MRFVKKSTFVASIVTYPHFPEPSLCSGDESRESVLCVGLDVHSIPFFLSGPWMTPIVINTITNTALGPIALCLGSFDHHGFWESVGSGCLLGWSRFGSADAVKRGEVPLGRRGLPQGLRRSLAGFSALDHRVPIAGPSGISLPRSL